MKRFSFFLTAALLCLLVVSCSKDDDDSSGGGSNPVVGRWVSSAGWGNGVIIFNANHTGTIEGQIGPNTRFPEGSFTYRIEVDGKNQYGSEGFIYATYTSVTEGTPGFTKTWEFSYTDTDKLFLEGTRVQKQANQ